MSRLTIDAVCTKKQVYPVIINFQNGYPTDHFEIDCALVLQGKNRIRMIATELDELVYAGQEHYEDLGRTFILAKDKNTGKVRLIESGSAELKPQNENKNQLLEKSNVSHIQQETDKLESDKQNYIPVLIETCNLKTDTANYPPQEKTSLVNTNINNNFQQLVVPDSLNSSQQLNTDEFEPERSISPQKLNNESGEPDLNILFSIAPQHNELESNEYNRAEQPDTCESELNITNNWNNPQHNELEPNKYNCAEQLDTCESELNVTNHWSNPQHNELVPKKYNRAEQLDTCKSELNITSHSRHLEISELQKETTDSEANQIQQIEVDSLQLNNNNENVEKDIKESNLVDITTELHDGKYNHMMNYYHDELFVSTVENYSKTNLTRKNEKLKVFKDFSTVHEMFIKALGLKQKVHKKLKAQNMVHKNHTNKQKNNVSVTPGHKGIINKQSNDDNDTENTFSYKFNKQVLESQAYTCGYCENVFEDKGSLIFHLVSHKFIRNSKNVVLKPLVERIVEVANTNSNTCRTIFGNHKRYKKKRNDLDSAENMKAILLPPLSGGNKRYKKKRNDLDSAENMKAIEDDFTRSCDDDNRNTINGTATFVSNAEVNSETTEKLQSFYKKDETTNNSINLPMHFVNDSTNKSKTSENRFICNHCKERFKDKYSLIFHFRTCNNDCKTPKNVKVRKDDSIEIYHDDDATTNHEAYKAKENDAVNIEQTKHLQKLCNEIKIADHFENCLIHLEQDNSHENSESQVIPERDHYICEHCEKGFEEKGSQIFHLVAHKINSTIQDIDKKCKINYEKYNTIGEKIKCLQSSENIIETIKIREYGSKTICDEDLMTNHELRNVKGNVLLNPEQRKNGQINNNLEVLNDSINATENNTSNISQEAAGKDLICNYCKKAFEQKTLLICHLADHHIHNSLKIANDNTSTRKFTKRNMNEKNGSETSENVIGTINILEKRYMSSSKDDVTNNHEANKVIETLLVNPEEKENAEMYTKVEITDDIYETQVPDDVTSEKEGQKKGRGEECEIMGDFKNGVTHLLNCNFITNENQISPSNIIFDYCNKKCEEKESLILHLQAHKVNVTMNVRKLRSSNKHLKHEEIVQNVCVNNISKRVRKNVVATNRRIRTENIETRSSNSRINRSQLKDKINNAINIRLLRSSNKNHTEEKHKEILVNTCGNNFNNVCKKNIVKKDKRTSLDNIEITSPNIINASQSKKVLRVLISPSKNVINNQIGKKVITMKEASEDNNFICNDCGRVLKSKDTLIDHLKTHSENSRLKSKNNARNLKYSCGICQYKFATQSEIINHEINVHNSRKPYKSCTLCGYKTPYRIGLADHMRAHLNIKPFKCCYCVKAFGTKSILNKHIRRHTGEKPYKCEICSKAFPVKSDLYLHGLTHAKKAFKCAICRISFTRAFELERHMIIHSNKKPFKCTTCSSRFSDRSALMRHERRHTGEKPRKPRVLRISGSAELPH